MGLAAGSEDSGVSRENAPSGLKRSKYSEQFDPASSQLMVPALAKAHTMANMIS